MASNSTNSTIQKDRPEGQSLCMAGAEGFEPPNAWTKTMCLTTWPRPNIYAGTYDDVKVH